MTEREGALCQSCGAFAVGAFVEGGSYFTRCMACRAEGPATSWLTLKRHLQGNLKAIAVTRQFEVIEVVAQGEAGQIADAISKAAYAGRLIRLLASGVSA
jgi:hypothetical protein